jgi:hypothetical protein
MVDDRDERLIHRNHLLLAAKARADARETAARTRANVRQSTPRQGGRDRRHPCLDHSTMRRQPPQNDPVEELARFECMRLIRAGTLDNLTVFILRESGMPWSKIRDGAPT